MQMLLEVMHEAEDTIAHLEAQQAIQQAELAADGIADKEDFFARLDLKSYAGRSRANGILKRLGIEVGIDTATPAVPRLRCRRAAVRPVFPIRRNRHPPIRRNYSRRTRSRTW